VCTALLSCPCFLCVRSYLAAKPSCREDVVKWFQDVESRRAAAISPSTGKVAKWFHGKLMDETDTKPCSNKHT